MKRISLEKLLGNRRNSSYQEQYEYIRRLLDEEKIKPVKASKTNGKKPALYREYWIMEPHKDYSRYAEEIKYDFSPLLSVSYYLEHLDNYVEDRQWVLLLNAYLKEHKDDLTVPESVNERSFEIWKKEKFLDREQGKKILRRCGLELDFLNVYKTGEPLSYYTNTRNTPQNILILENKDPFFSMRKHLLNGNTKILNTEIGTLIYGAGKGILRSFRDFDICGEPYMRKEENQIFYFGDLDYEGIGIYENLALHFADTRKIIPFIPAYKAILQKAGSTEMLPDTKEKQNRNIQSLFFSYFDENTVKKMLQILEADKYIPQEILNLRDF